MNGPFWWDTYRWPKYADNKIEMFEDGAIYFDGDRAPESFKISQCSDGWNQFKSAKYTNEVTCEQYEAALADSKRVAWDGEGLPPVGCEYDASVDGRPHGLSGTQ